MKSAMQAPAKILAVQSKYFGDAVMMVPALRALRARWPAAELHLLLPAEIAPVLQHLPWINKVWAIPRKRGQAAAGATWPILRALRRERFDCAVDFSGNDRAAILTWLSGARRRLGRFQSRGFWGRRWCYHQIGAPPAADTHESVQLVRLLAAWDVPPPASMELELRSDPALDAFARDLVPGRPVLGHLSTGMLKKEWPVTAWAGLFQLAAAAGLEMIFSSGVSPRERALLDELQRLAPAAKVLPALPDIRQFLAVLARARVFVGGDTGPLHFAAGLGVPTIALYGPTSARQWAPLGARHRVLQGAACTCPGAQSHCTSPHPCLAGLSPATVAATLQSVLAAAVKQP